MLSWLFWGCFAKNKRKSLQPCSQCVSVFLWAVLLSDLCHCWCQRGSAWQFTCISHFLSAVCERIVTWRERWDLPRRISFGSDFPRQSSVSVRILPCFLYFHWFPSPVFLRLLLFRHCWVLCFVFHFLMVCSVSGTCRPLSLMFPRVCLFLGLPWSSLHLNRCTSCPPPRAFGSTFPAPAWHLSAVLLSVQIQFHANLCYILLTYFTLEQSSPAINPTSW